MQEIIVCSIQAAAIFEEHAYQMHLKEIMMTRGCLAAILLSLASFPASAADATTCGSVEMPRQKADEETIKRIESAWLTAEFRGNVDYLDCLLDPGYRVITTRTG